MKNKIMHYIVFFFISVYIFQIARDDEKQPKPAAPGI